MMHGVIVHHAEPGHRRRFHAEKLDLAEKLLGCHRAELDQPLAQMLLVPAGDGGRIRQLGRGRRLAGPDEGPAAMLSANHMSAITRCLASSPAERDFGSGL